MTTYHIVVTGSRPEKGADNKFLPMPKENVEFIQNTLAKVAPSDYAFLYHGMANGVDAVADDFAFRNQIHVKQFPAYWFDPTKDGNVDKRAGLFRNEAMVRQANDDAHNKEDHQVIVLAFYNTATIEESTGTNHCATYAEKKGNTVRKFQLPVQKGSAAATQEAAMTPAGMPDPFGQ